MPISDSAASELAQLLRSGTAGELIPELVRQGLQALIEAEAAAALVADRHERSDQRVDTAMAVVIAFWPHRLVTCSCTAHASAQGASCPCCWGSVAASAVPCGWW